MNEVTHTMAPDAGIAADVDDLIPPLPVRKVRLVQQMPTPKPQAVTRGMDAPVLVGVADPALHPEVSTIVAATGRTRLDTTQVSEILKHAPRACAIILDPEVAAGVVSHQLAGTIFLVHADPGPVDWKLAMQLHAEEALVLPAQAPELLAALGRREKVLHADTFALSIAGAVGGAGTSTLSAAVATQAAGSVLIDADPRGGGLDLLLGVEEHTGVRWNDLGRATGLDAAALLAALPEVEGFRLLGPARTQLHHELEPAQLRGVADTLGGHASLIFDTAGVGECFEQAVAHSDAVALVVPAEVRAAVAAHGLARALDAQRIKPFLVVRHRGWSGLSASEIEDVVGAPVVAEIPTVRRLAKRIETQGLGARMPKPLRAAARAVTDKVRELA